MAATTHDYVRWITANQHLKGTPKYQEVIAAYDRQYAIEKQQAQAQAQQAQAQQVATRGIQSQQSTPPPAPLTGIFDLLGSGATRTLAASRISGDVLFNGEQEQENAQSITEALIEGQRAIPKQLQEVRDAFKNENEMYERGEYIKGTLSSVFEFGKQSIGNPVGMAYSVAEQAANMAPGIVGAYLGGKTAALTAGTATAATGAGAPIAPFIAGAAGLGGSVAGGFAGQAPVEAGSEFIGRVGEELEKRGLEVNEANVAALLRDKKWVTQAASDARVKGITTALVDAAFTTGAAKLARGPMEKAMKKASDELGAGANIEQIVGRAEQIVGDRKLRTKMADAAKATGLDVVGGGTSEAAGQLAAYGEVSAEDVLQEMLGELGGAALEIPSVAAGLAKRRPAGEEPDPLAPAPPAGGALTPAGGTPGTPTTGGTPGTPSPPTTGGTPAAPVTGGTPGAPNQPVQETPEQRKAREKKERIEQAMGIITQHTQSTGNKNETQENEWSMVLQQQMGLSPKDASSLLNEMGNKQNKLITGKKGDNNTRSIVDETEEKRLAEERKKKQSERANAILSQATGQTTPAAPVVAAPVVAPVVASTLTKEAENVLAMDPAAAELQFADVDGFNQLTEIAKANGISVDENDMATNVIDKLRNKKATPVTAPVTAPATTAPAVSQDDTYNKAVAYIDTLRADIDTALEARITRDLLAEKLGIDKEAATKLRKLLVDNGQIKFTGELKSRPKPAAPAAIDTAVDTAKEAAKEGLGGTAVDPRNPKGLPTSPPKEGGAWIDLATGKVDFAFAEGTIDEGDNIPFDDQQQIGEVSGQAQAASEVKGTEGGASGTETVAGGAGAGVPVSVPRTGTGDQSSQEAKPPTMGFVESGTKGSAQGAGTGAAPVRGRGRPRKEKPAPTSAVIEAPKTANERIADLETAIRENRLIGKNKRDAVAKLKKSLASKTPPSEDDIQKELKSLENTVRKDEASPRRATYLRAKGFVAGLRDRLLDRKKRAVEEDRREADLENENIDLVYDYIKQNGKFDSAAIQEEHGINPNESTDILRRLRDEARVVGFSLKNADVADGGVIRTVETKLTKNTSLENLYFKTIEDRVDELDSLLDGLDSDQIEKVLGPKLPDTNPLAAKQNRIQAYLDTIEKSVEGSVVATGGVTETGEKKKRLVANMEDSIAHSAFLDELQKRRDELRRGTAAAAAQQSGKGAPVSFSAKLYNLAKTGDLNGVLALMRDNAEMIGVDDDIVARWSLASENAALTTKEKIKAQQDIIDDEKSSDAKKENARKEIERLQSGKSVRQVRIEKRMAAIREQLKTKNEQSDQDEIAKLNEKLGSQQRALDRILGVQKAQKLSQKLSQGPSTSFERAIVRYKQALTSSIIGSLQRIDLSSVRTVVEEAGAAPDPYFQAMRKAGKAAAYDPKTNTIYLTADAFQSPMLIAHEVAHAVTAVTMSEFRRIASTIGRAPAEYAQELFDAAQKEFARVSKENNYDPESDQDMPPAVESARYALDDAEILLNKMNAATRITEIFEQAKKQLGTMPMADAYFENVLEFIAYAFTDSRLQLALNDVRMPKGMSRVSQVVGKTIDMLTELSQTVLELLGIIKYRNRNAAKKAKADAAYTLAVAEHKAISVAVKKTEKALTSLNEEATREYNRNINAVISKLTKLRDQEKATRKDLDAFAPATDTRVGRLGAGPKIDAESTAFKEVLVNKLSSIQKEIVETQNKLASLTEISSEQVEQTINEIKRREQTSLEATLVDQKAKLAEAFKNLQVAKKNYSAVMDTKASYSYGVDGELISQFEDVELDETDVLADFLEAVDEIMTAPGTTTNLPMMYARGSRKNKSGTPQKTKKPGYKDATTVAELDNVARESLYRKLKREAPKFLPLGEYYLGNLQGWRNLSRDIQNSRRWLLDFQNDLDLAGKLVILEKGFNNIYDLITTSAAKAKNAFNTAFGGPTYEIDRGLVKLNKMLAKKFKTTVDPETNLPRAWQFADTVAWLDLRLKAMHMDERRAIKYLLNVPMSDVKNIPIKMPDGSIEMMSAAGYRDVLYRELLKDEDMTVETGNGNTQLIRQIMETLVKGGELDANGNPKFGIPVVGINAKTGFSAYLDPEGRATNDRDYPDGKVPKARPLDKRDDKYNVYAGLDGYINDPNDPNNGKSKSQMLIDDYNSFASDPDMGPVLTTIVDNLRLMQDRTKNYNKDTNYQSVPVSNLIDFYNWDFYVPLKGVDGKTTEISPGDARWDISGTRVASDVIDNPQAAAGGRMSDSDNVISRIKDDAFKSASRVGRDGVNTAIGNLVGMLGESFGEVALEINFMERHTGAANKALRDLKGKDDVFFEYKPNGDLVAYKINNKEAAFAIRRTYQPVTSFDTFMGKWTSRISQLHTRFKLSFAPYDFLRNATFNSSVFAARYGVKKGAKMGMAVATRLGRNSWGKAGRVLLAHQKGDFQTIDKLAKKSQIYRDMQEFLVEGGESAYIQIFAQSGKLGTMLEELDKSKFRMTAEKTGEFVTGAFDLYNNMFELANRSASYGVVRDEMIGQLTKEFKKKNQRDPTPAEKKFIYKQAMQRAASYTKNLTNFELTGARANKLIANYAFFRPAATGAVSALDAIMPIWVDAKTMYKHMTPELKAVLDKDPEARKNYANNYRQIQKNARTTAVVSFMAGMAVYMMAKAMGDEDDEGRNKVAVDDKAQWTRNARIPLNWILDTLPDDSVVKRRFKDKVFNLPFGFGFGAIASSGAQFAMLANGDVGFKDFLFNNVIIAADSFMPLPVSRINPWEHENGPFIGAFLWAFDSMMPSLVRPAFELVANVNGLGREIFTENVNKYGPAYQSTDKVMELYAGAAQDIEEATGIDVQPTELAFLAGSYLDGVSEVMSWGNSLADLYYTDRGFDPKTDTLVLNRFIGAPSRIDPKKYYRVSKVAESYSKKLNMYYNTDYERYIEYVGKNPNSYAMASMHNQLRNGELKSIQEQINYTRADKRATPMEKQLALKELYDRRDHIMYQAVQLYEDLGVEVP